MSDAFVHGCIFLFCAFTLPVHSQETKTTFTGAPMSMNFQNIEVRTALQILADFTGLNIITSDSVTGALTLKLHKVPWDQVLDIMAQAKGLSVRRPVSYTHLTLPTICSV